MMRLKCFLIIFLWACSSDPKPKTKIVAPTSLPKPVEKPRVALESLSEESKTISCSQVLVCDEPGTEIFLCRLQSRFGKFSSWGKGACQARQALQKSVCKSRSEGIKQARIQCIPEPTNGECPKKIEELSCDPNIKTTAKRIRCQAKFFRGQPLPMERWLQGYGQSLCHAKQSLIHNACENGYLPSQISGVSCEPDTSQGECPPAYSCIPKSETTVKCQVSDIAGKKLEEPWLAESSSSCESIYRLEQKACRLASQKNKVRPSQLGDAICEEI
ncbi:MAG: hypothetical protein HRU19_11795 [Pseudobacteriovorax sp.]|nr:hypothetical protein [Pseudobacteriovorax sp.]